MDSLIATVHGCEVETIAIRRADHADIDHAGPSHAAERIGELGEGVVAKGQSGCSGRGSAQRRAPPRAIHVDGCRRVVDRVALIRIRRRPGGRQGIPRQVVNGRTLRQLERQQPVRVQGHVHRQIEDRGPGHRREAAGRRVNPCSPGKSHIAQSQVLHVFAECDPERHRRGVGHLRGQILPHDANPGGRQVVDRVRLVRTCRRAVGQSDPCQIVDRRVRRQVQIDRSVAAGQSLHRHVVHRR